MNQWDRPLLLFPWLRWVLRLLWRRWRRSVPVLRWLRWLLYFRLVRQHLLSLWHRLSLLARQPLLFPWLRWVLRLL